jgi:hypothetical protein
VGGMGRGRTGNSNEAADNRTLSWVQWRRLARRQKEEHAKFASSKMALQGTVYRYY